MRIDLQRLIAESKQLLEELQNGTHEIITRASPATWEDLRSDLETKLVPILERLYDRIGGLMEQPHVVLPDGVTSTSLVSQSEMTQFVTDTLNAWLGDLANRIDKAKKNSIYTFQPNVIALKYVPLNVPVNLTMGQTEPKEISILFSKVSKAEKSISLLELSIVKPTITIAKGE